MLGNNHKSFFPLIIKSVNEPPSFMSEQPLCLKHWPKRKTINPSEMKPIKRYPWTQTPTKNQDRYLNMFS